MVQKPSTKAGFRPPVPQSPHLYREATEILRLDGQLDESHLHARLRRITYQMTRLGNLVSSFQIEGIAIDRAHAARALAGQSAATPYEQDIQEFGALYDELHNANTLPRLTPELIREWHARLFTAESLDHGAPGAWKTGTNGVWNNAKHDWVFIATPREDTLPELERLIEWHEQEAYRLPAPIAAAIFFAELECIHPFADGNGRLGRLLNLYALKSHGLANAFLAPIDEAFKRRQGRYHAALETTNRGDSYAEWTSFYLAELREAYERAKHLGRLDEVLAHMPRPSTRAVLEWILAYRADDWFARGDYPNDEKLSGSTLTTALGELATLGLLEGTGEKKGRKYRLDWNKLQEMQAKAATRAEPHASGR